MREQMYFSVDFLWHHFIQNVCCLMLIVRPWMVAIVELALEYNFKRLKTAYDDAFRVLLNVPRWTSASFIVSIT